jgi:DNA-binding response OmpR family regulator
MTHSDKEIPRILVIDDEPLAVELLDTRLSDFGYEVATACSAEEGLAADRKFRPHLILLDVMLPEMSGFEACRKFKEIHKDTYVPIILLTSMDDVNSKVKGLDSGAYDYVTKPFDSQELLARVSAALRTKRLYDELKATREKLTEAERLATVGKLTITLHHEINNPLQAIVLATENLLSDLAEEDISREDIEIILTNCARIDDVLKQMANLKRIRSAPYVGDIDMIDLGESVSE